MQKSPEKICLKWGAALETSLDLFLRVGLTAVHDDFPGTGTGAAV